MPTTLTLPPTIITGAGASENVGEQAKQLGATNALIVTDPGIAKIGYADNIAQNLHNAGITTSCFSDVTPDPTLQNVQDGLKQYTDEGCDVIVSIGGGSAIDCGKGIAMKLATMAISPIIWVWTRSQTQGHLLLRYRQQAEQAARFPKLRSSLIPNGTLR